MEVVGLFVILLAATAFLTFGVQGATLAGGEHHPTAEAASFCNFADTVQECATASCQAHMDAGCCAALHCGQPMLWSNFSVAAIPFAIAVLPPPQAGAFGSGRSTVPEKAPPRLV